MTTRFRLMAVILLAVGLVAIPAAVSGQLTGLATCGGYLAPPLPLDYPCRFVCVRQMLGNPSPMQPQPSRMVWQKVCHVKYSGVQHGPLHLQMPPNVK